MISKYLKAAPTKNPETQDIATLGRPSQLLLEQLAS